MENLLFLCANSKMQVFGDFRVLAVSRRFAGIHVCLEVSGVSGPLTLEIQSSRDLDPKVSNLIYLDLDPQTSVSNLLENSFYCPLLALKETDFTAGMASALSGFLDQQHIYRHHLRAITAIPFTSY